MRTREQTTLECSQRHRSRLVKLAAGKLRWVGARQTARSGVGAPLRVALAGGHVDPVVVCQQTIGRSNGTAPVRDEALNAGRVCVCLRWQTHPRVTKSVTAATIGAAGDQVQQAFERLDDPAQRNDLARTTRMAAFGGLFVGPFLHWWYGRLEALFPANVPLRTVKKVALDQVRSRSLWQMPQFG